jgi:hypothetical protein
MTHLRQVGKKDQNRKVHAPDDQWMGFGKRFEKITFKETGLSLIVYFFKFHGAKIIRAAKILG